MLGSLAKRIPGCDYHKFFKDMPQSLSNFGKLGSPKEHLKL